MNLGKLVPLEVHGRVRNAKLAKMDESGYQRDELGFWSELWCNERLKAEMNSAKPNESQGDL